MLPDKSIGCHRTFGQLKVRSCHDMVVRHRCQLWVAVDGINKNTGEHVKKHSCLDSLQHILHLETVSITREVSAEVSMHRKENIDQSMQAAQNAAALNENLIKMHQQTVQVGLAQVKAIQQAQQAISAMPDVAPKLLEHSDG